MKLRKILVIIAMQGEADPIIQALGIKGDGRAIEPPLPPVSYRTTFQNLDVHLVVNGQDPVYKLDSFGTDAATLSTYLGVKTFTPDLVISAGTAGGFKTQARIGDVYVSADSVRYFDRRVSITDPDYQDYAIGYYPVLAEAGQIAAALGLKTGIVVTGGSFENSLIDDRQIRNLEGSVVEMECAAVAKMSMLFGVRFLALKAVVDFDDAVGFASQFDDNFKLATQNLASQLVNVLDYLAQNEVA